ncbi:MAG: hypothetical protein QNL33_18690 [Akkermansiaceae bacterium]
MLKSIVSVCLLSLARADSGAIETSKKLAPLFEASLEFYDTLQRTSKGLYRDSYLPEGDLKKNRTCSSAAVGIGLMGLCMEHRLGRDDEAGAKALQTLRALNGKVVGFAPARDSSGFHRHFFDSENGEGTSEFSTIDTAIMVVGALYCRNTFDHPAIRREADQLWNSIDWQLALASQDGRRLHMTAANGKPGDRTVTQLFNEYYLLAWLIHEEAKQRGIEGSLPNLEDLPMLTRENITVLAEPRLTPQSSFTIQFPFYMSQPGSSKVSYTSFVQNQAKLDQRISSRLNGADRFWGCGAGITPDKGYLASNFDDNPGKMVSPHIIAGFLPVSPIAQVHLLKLYSDPSLRLKTPAGEILPRFSVEKPSWRPPRIESIDYASMIFGLAAIHPNLGMEFFSQGDAIYVRAPVGLNSAACL